jgi:crotonobetainyl-CoA:carnitine CoA-transferase CaiB-like acyl-CoA transferase
VHADVDVIALPCLLAPEQRHEDARQRMQRAYDVSDGHARHGRHLVSAERDAERAAERHRRQIVRNLLERLGRPDLIAPCEKGPGPHQQPVIQFLQSVFREKPLAHWRNWFEGMDVSFAPVNTLREALDDPCVRARGLILHDPDGREYVAPAVRFLKEPAEPRLKAPLPGEHMSLLGGKS